MEIEKIMDALNAVSSKTLKYYKFNTDSVTKNCNACKRYDGKIYVENDVNMPSLPIHPNCDCYFTEVSENDFLQQENYQFGAMSPEKWSNLSIDEKNMWCNKFREFFGDYIDKYAKQYNIPKQLLAGIIANEMIDWKFPDGTWFDGIKGGGIGYAQITLDTAREYGFSGSNTELKQLLNSYEGSVAAASKILKNYLDSFQQDIENNNLGKGFSESVLYYMANPAILKNDDLTRLNVPEWLLNSMSAAWNSGVKVFHAKDKIGKNNYRNAFIHGENSSLLYNYLSKLVNE